MASNGKKPNLPTGRQGKKSKILKVKIKTSWKNFLLYGFLFLFMLFLFMGINQDAIQRTKSVPISQVIQDVKQGKVSEIIVLDNKLTVKEGEQELDSFKEPGANVYQIFKDAGV
ncbi:MAG: hypothetical protein HYT07_03295, partial [Candidatus Levybacteria bacterium]|nr:hypothetical protein [Candidatus Levybacteria bacterium]